MMKEKVNKLINKLIWYINKLIWYIYAKQGISGIVFYLIGLFLLLKLKSWLGVSSYEIREILKALLDTNIIRNLPSHWQVFITFIIPLIFPFLIRVFVKDQLLPVDTSQLISTLYDRCWEICKLGQIWVRDSTQRILDKIDGLRTGIQIDSLEVSEIVNALYEITDAKIIQVTWLLDIATLTDQQKSYIEITQNKVRQLNKFSLTRYFIGDDINIFTNNPSRDVIWFVTQHNGQMFNLKFVQRNTWQQICENYGIPIHRADVLFFDKRLALLLVIDPTTFTPILINNSKYILEITDTRTDNENYSRFFKDLDNNSTDIRQTIQDDPTLRARYGF